MDIYDEIVKALEIEERVMLATIISTSGSTPASALSKMLVTKGGLVSVGTVGGGCMEGDVLLHAQRLYETGKAEILTFHLNEDDIEHGLICGGSLDILIEPLTKQQIPLIQQLKAIRDEGEDCILVSILGKNGKIEHKSIMEVNVEGKEKGSDRIMELGSRTKVENLSILLDSNTPPLSDEVESTSGRQRSVADLLHKAHRRNTTTRVTTPDGELILEPITGSPSLIIFGGGHVSKYISRAASMAGFRVTIIDDRNSYANPGRFPEAVQTLAVDFADVFVQCNIKPSTYIVIVTRGHRYDEEILERALRTPAKYIGMIGSRRKVLTTYEHLVERGTPVDALRRVHAPMGIEIGAITAEEIGVSVVAELIKVRRGERLPPQHKAETMVELIEKLKREEISDSSR